MFSKSHFSNRALQLVLFSLTLIHSGVVFSNQCSDNDKNVEKFFGIESSDIYSFLKEFAASKSEVQRSESQLAFLKRAEVALKTGTFHKALHEFLGSKTKMTVEQRDTVIQAFSEAVGVELGRLTSKHPNRTWAETSAILANEVKKSGNSKVGSSEFISELSRLTRSRFYSAENTRVLRKGPQSFGVRDNIIKNSRESIWIASWAIYADYTGKQAVNQLIKKHREGIDVRVMVDGNNSLKPFAKAEVDRLVAAGIPVIRWRLESEGHFGMHRKLLVVDGKYAICGGMNFGNEYSHRKTTKNRDRWRDTDLYFEGEAALDGSAVFAKAWNHFANLTGQVKPIEWQRPSPKHSRSRESIMLVDHEPTLEMTKDPIYLATLKLIDGAKGTIDISNAYYIETPAIREAIVRVLKDPSRKVKVRVHTNSADSVDVDALIRPIYRGLKPLLEAGAQIYVHQGTTTHSKYMLVDGHMGWIGSYNLHPRSHKFESETVALFNSQKIGYELQEMFERDLKSCRKVTSINDIEFAANPMADFAEALFFDQL